MSGRLLLALMLGVFMGALDNAILAPALPAIAQDLGTGVDRVTLAFSVYSVFYAVAVPILGRLADLLGYGRVYGVSMALFAGGSALAALSQSLETLVLARVVQAVGAGGLFPVAQAIVGVVAPEERRGAYLGQILGVFALGNVLGPNLGGFIVERATWPWVFWINVPIGVLGVLLLSRTPLPQGQRRAQLDLLGGALVALTFGSLVLGIQGLERLGEVGFLSWRIGGLFLLALLSGLALLLYEARHPAPLLDVRLALSPPFLPIWFVSTLVGYALLGGIVFAPLYAQVGFFLSPFASGAILNALALALGAVSGAAGALVGRVGGKRLTVLGMGLTALGLFLMAYLSGALWTLLLGLFLLGMGLGLVQGPLSHLALSLAPPGSQGQVSSLVSLTRSLGAAAGITVSGVLLARRSQELASLTAGGPVGFSGEVGNLAEAPAFVKALLQNTLGAGVLDGWRLALLAALLGLLASLWLRERGRPHPQARGQEEAIG
ncbi:MFS transporter [Thermus sp.]|uniref:MFS transporter n=2 Tax=Thermus sp. TaxID=275 RepID=UPI0025EE377A|nr:MFS transporter [Thermus sp.]MCS6867240.1 MFS transporter [Thermus sp.]